ncbi:Ldh family oxidoreductase [Mesorhizobium sp. M0965]|uniref:Ldh family oxidoreductase n=1 Tax=unclassified Mesorhizobium TaxID=325217 RepID=UPI0033396367
MNSNSSCTLYSADALDAFVTKVLQAIGVDDVDARYMAGIIIASELSGHPSCGLRQLPDYVLRWQQGKATTHLRPQIEKDSGSVLVIDGQGCFGHVVMRMATALAVERAQSHGISLIAIRRSEPAGRYADFCEYAAGQGVITLMFVNDSGGCQEVSPPGARAPRLSTNPFAIGVPRASRPHLVLDMATSAVAFGRLLECRERGESIPTDWVTNEGFMRPFGGAKGFGLAVMVEALAGALTGGGTVGPNPLNDDQAMLIIAIDVKHVRSLSEFTSDVESFVGYIKDAPLEVGAAGIRMPGEGGAANAAERMQAGIDIQLSTRGKLFDIAREFKIGFPECISPAPSNA